MSGVLNLNPGLENISINSSYPTLVSQTHSLKRQVRTRGAQRWIIKGDFPTMERADAMRTYAFFLSQKGRYDTFTYVPDVLGYTGGTVTTSTINVDNVGGYSTGATIIHVDGLSSNYLIPGDYIKFSGHDKVYMITNTSNVTNNSDMNIEPPLVSSIADDEAILVNGVAFTVAMNTDNVEMKASPGGLFINNSANPKDTEGLYELGSLDLIEVI